MPRGGKRPNTGGARPNSGPRPTSIKDEVKALFDEACPLESRKTIIRTMTAYAQSGNPRAAAFIFDRCYGTPQSGDELKIQEAIDADFDKLTATLQKVLTPSAWREVADALGLD